MADKAARSYSGATDPCWETIIEVSQIALKNNHLLLGLCEQEANQTKWDLKEKAESVKALY